MNLKQLTESFTKFLKEQLKLTGKESKEELEAMLDNPELSDNDMDSINDALANIDLKGGEVEPMTTSIASTPLKINLVVGKTYTYSKKLVTVGPKAKDIAGQTKTGVYSKKVSPETFDEAVNVKKTDQIQQFSMDVQYLGRINDFDLKAFRATPIKQMWKIAGKIINALDDMNQKKKGSGNIAEATNYYVFIVPEQNNAIKILSGEEVNKYIWQTDELIDTDSIITNDEKNDNVENVLKDTPGKINDVKILPLELIQVLFSNGTELKFDKESIFLLLKKYHVVYDKPTTAAQQGSKWRNSLNAMRPEEVIENEKDLITRLNYIKTAKPPKEDGMEIEF